MASVKRKRESNHLPEEGYRKFTFQEIQQATDCFSEDKKIREVRYGAVYKGYLHHTPVSVKLVKDQGIKQLKTEIEVLSKIHHPHLVLLLGACSDKGCLVYEYMANGSLEERLQCNGTHSLPWYTRFNIAWEIASALNFLHLTKPNPVVHGDLKPASILLDSNCLSKVADFSVANVVSLAPISPNSSASTVTEYKMPKSSSKMGVLCENFCYIDPECSRTGRFMPTSDIYAFGIILLQLITARPPLALIEQVEIAIKGSELDKIIDKRAGEWPCKETLELAKLGLKCAELRRGDRADLEREILPKLTRLKAVAEKAAPLAPLRSFICPITEDVMKNPHVAADGFTYEYESIKTWLSDKCTSPMTNMPLSHKNLIANVTLRSAILEWKSLTKKEVNNLNWNLCEGESENGRQQGNEKGSQTDTESEKLSGSGRQSEKRKHVTDLKVWGLLNKNSM